MHLNSTFAAVLTWVLLASEPAAAADRRLDFIPEELDVIKEVLDMPAGLGVAVIEGDRLIFEHYAGLADIEHNIPVDETTSFYIASTTKPFVALAALLAERRGDLSRSSTLRDLFPDLAFDNIDPEAVTVQHLLTHSSGVDNSAFTWAASWSGQHDAALRRRFVASLEPRGEPGTFEYTNLGYNVMSVWFDSHYGRDWRETLEQFVLAPLGMERTTGFISEVRSNGWSFAQPYSYKHAGGKRQIYLRKDDSTMYSIGLVSTPRDVARFISAQLNEGRLDGRQVFPPDVIQRSQTREIDVASYYDGYAWGWQLGRFREERDIFHTGGFPGASALISFLPDRDIGIVVLQNESGLRANHLAQIVKDLVYGALLDEPTDIARKQARARAEQLAQQVMAAQEELAVASKRLSATEWNLEADSFDYGGIYENELAGKIVVRSTAAEAFRFTWGNLEGKAFAHEEPDTMLIEFRPGDYQTARFRLVGGRVRELSMNGYAFRKRDQGPE